MKPKKIINSISKIMPVDRVLPLIVCVIFNGLVYWGGQMISASKYQYHMSFSWEVQIPLVPWTLMIYLGCYIFWIVNYILSVRFDEKSAFRFMTTELICKAICFLCFVFLPATLKRPVITDESFWGNCMRLLYKMDPPLALFPSIHCLVSWMCFIGIRKQKYIPLWYKLLSLTLALAVCVSTLTTKQHVFMDVVAGIILPEIVYWIVGATGCWAYTLSFFKKVNRRLFTHGE